MEIKLKNIKIRDVIANYFDNSQQQEGIYGMNGKLNIRPPYQREFVYKDKKRDAVINTIINSFPLNVMYWVKTGEDTYEILDGQQRTISFCQYINSVFDINYQYFHNLTEEEQNKILDYELMIYICEGTKKEQLEWFKVINIAGEKLYDQELRNALYTGSWLTDAKRKFSKTNCACQDIASDYLNGSAIRQDYLEQALKWIIDKNNLNAVEEYMANNQHTDNANELWLYFSQVIEWVKTVFPVYRRQMKGVPWGILYNKYHKNTYNQKDLEVQIKKLMIDDDVTNKKGIYEYLITGDEKYLNIRKFSQAMKSSVYEKQEGKCNKCKKNCEIEDMEADHIDPWSRGGKTSLENCQILCVECNRRKSNI